MTQLQKDDERSMYIVDSQKPNLQDSSFQLIHDYQCKGVVRKISRGFRSPFSERNLKHLHLFDDSQLLYNDCHGIVIIGVAHGTGRFNYTGTFVSKFLASPHIHLLSQPLVHV